MLITGHLNYTECILLARTTCLNSMLLSTRTITLSFLLIAYLAETVLIIGRSMSIRANSFKVTFLKAIEIVQNIEIQVKP